MIKLTKWAIYFDENDGEITMLFDDNGNFIKLEDENLQEKYKDDISNWDIGNWKEFDVKGNYEN